MTRALVLWALLCGAAQAQIGTSLGAPMSPAIGSSFPSAIQSPGDIPWWVKAPLIDEDVNTVAHVYWRNGALVDSKGNSWTQNGTVTQAGASGFVPPGAGPFSDANYYSLGAGSDVLDFAGDFTITIVFRAGSNVNGNQIANGAAYGGVGWATLEGGSHVTAWYVNGSLLANTATSKTPGKVYVSSFGMSGTDLRGLENLGTARAGTATVSPATAATAKIGRYEGAGAAFDGTILEFYATTTAATDANMRAIHAAVLSRMRVSP